MYNFNSKEAKNDKRLQSSGDLKHFKFFDKIFKLEPKTAFYDWLYVKALGNNKDLINEIRKFNIFSDIKFNPNKSLNCQARSLAIFRTLQERNINFNELENVDNFLKFYNDEWRLCLGSWQKFKVIKSHQEKFKN